MNIYYFTFPFRGEYHFIKMNANMLANHLINMMGEYDFTYEDGQYYEKKLTSKNPETGEFEEVCVSFNYQDPSYVDVFYPNDLEDEDMAGKIIEKNIPCLLTRVVDNKNLKDLFDINDDIY